MFLCSGAGAAQPPSEGVLRGTRKNKAIGAVFRYGTCASGPREHACGSRQLRKFSRCPQIVHGNAIVPWSARVPSSQARGRLSAFPAAARAVCTCRATRFAPPRARRHACGCREMRTRQRAAICSTVDDRWVVAAQQPQSRGVVTTFEPRARALTVRMFGAITAVLSGRCESVAVCLSPAVTLLQLLSATCSTSMVVLWSATTARTALAARRSKPESGREQNTGDGCAIARDGGGEGLHALELSLRRLQRAGPQLRRPWVHQCSEDAGGQQRPPRLRVPRLQNRESLLESSADCRAFGRFQRSSQSPPGQSLHVRRQRGRRFEREV